MVISPMLPYVYDGKYFDRAKRIVKVTEECVARGLAAAKPWGHLGDIAYAINSHAQANGYSVVEDIGGHGIGLEFHEDPFVSYVTPKGSEMLLVPGMMFTIEPMINEARRTSLLTKTTDGRLYHGRRTFRPDRIYGSRHGKRHRDPDKIKICTQFKVFM